MFDTDPHPITDPDDIEAVKAELRAEIRLAQIEAANAPLYRPRPEDCLV